MAQLKQQMSEVGILFVCTLSVNVKVQHN